MSHEEGPANKREAEKYVQIAASAAASGNFNKAERMLHIAENLYSTPLGKKILIDIQNARVEKVPSQIPSNRSDASSASESSNETCDCNSSDECRQSPKTSISISSEEDFEGNVSQAAYHQQNNPINLKSFQDACASLDQAEKYFAMNEVDLKAKSKMKPLKKKSFEYTIDDNPSGGIETPTLSSVKQSMKRKKLKRHLHDTSKVKGEVLKKFTDVVKDREAK